MRQIWAIIVLVGVTLIAFALLSNLGAAMTWLLIDTVQPALSGQTPNTNTDKWGPLLLLPLALALGIVAAAFVLDPEMASRTEAMTVIIMFCLLLSISGVNFWAGDALIHVNAQMLIDIVLSICALTVITMIFRWIPSRITAIALQRVSLFLITVFGFVLPLFYATSLLLQRLGYGDSLGGVSGFIGFISAVCGLAAATAPSVLPRRRGQSVELRDRAIL